LSEEKMKCFYEDNELPWEDEFLQDFEPPSYQCDIDKGQGVGGTITFLTLLYRAFEIVKERRKEEVDKENEEMEKNTKEYMNMEEDLGRVSD
jgi:hypothetical protein